MTEAGLAFQLDALYSTRLHLIGQYTGRAFHQPAAHTLRVAALGINAYAAADGLGETSPEWFLGCMAEPSLRYCTGLQKRAKAIGTALAPASSFFVKKKYRRLYSLYATNAGKSYRLQSYGKRAAEMPDTRYEHYQAWETTSPATWHPAVAAPLASSLVGHAAAASVAEIQGSN